MIVARTFAKVRSCLWFFKFWLIYVIYSALQQFNFDPERHADVFMYHGDAQIAVRHYKTFIRQYINCSCLCIQLKMTTYSGTDDFYIVSEVDNNIPLIIMFRKQEIIYANSLKYMPHLGGTNVFGRERRKCFIDRSQQNTGLVDTKPPVSRRLVGEISLREIHGP